MGWKWWDKVAQASQAVGGAIYAPVGLAVDLAVAPWKDEEDYNGLINTLAGRTAARAKQAFAPVDFLAGPVDEAVGGGIINTLKFVDEEVYKPYIGRPISAINLAGAYARSPSITGKDESQQGFGESFLPGGDVDFFRVLGRAWDDAGKFSPGQAHALSLGAQARGSDFAAAIMSPTGDPMADAASAQIDWTKGRARIQSGATDILVRWYADPLVIGGKAAAAGRRLYLGPIKPDTDLTKILDSGRTNRFIEEIHKRQPGEERMDWLMRNKVVRQAADGPALADLLSRSDDVDETRHILGWAMGFNRDHRTVLEQQKNQLTAAMDAITEMRIPALEKAMAEYAGPKVAAYTAWGNKRIEQLRAESQILDQEIVERDLMLRSEATLDTRPRVTLNQRVSDATNWDIYQPSRFNAPVRVLRSATSMRAGVMDLDSPDSIIHLSRMLDRVGHGMGKNAALDKETKGRLLSAYARAQTQAEKRQVIAAAEQTAINKVGDVLFPGQPRTVTDAALQYGWKRRDELMNFLRQRTHAGTEAGYLDYVDTAGVVTRIPARALRIADQIPLLDVDAMTRVLSRYRSELAGDGDGFKAILGGARGSDVSRIPAEHLESAAAAFNRVWKPAQLLRLGWPLRVITDEQLRIISTVGIISHLPLVAKSVNARFNQSARKGQLAVQAHRHQRLDEIGGRVDEIDTGLHKVRNPDQRDAMIAERSKLLDERDNLEQWLVRSGEPDAPFGVGEIPVGPYRMPDAFGDDPMRANSFAMASSARPVWQRWVDDSGRWLDGLRMTSGLGAKHVSPREKGYEQAWERLVNEEITNHPVAKMILGGKTDDDVIDWLDSPAGRSVRQNAGWQYPNLAQHVAQARSAIEQYLPTPALRQLAYSRAVSKKDLAAAIPQKDLRPVLHGESLQNAFGNSPAWRGWNKIVDRMYQALGSTPTDVLSRHPFFANVYRKRINELVERADPRLDGTLTGKELTMLSERARQHALRKVKNTLYELSEESNLAHTLRFVMPFYAAWQEAMTRWLGLVVEDPARFGRGTQIWNAPNDANLTFTDENTGKTYVTMPMPQWARDHIPGARYVGEQAFDKKSLNLALAGDPWFLPGVGPMIAVPVGEVARGRPDISESLKYVLPYGAGDDALDLILPAGYRRALTTAKGEDDRVYANSLNRIIIEMETERRLGRLNLSDEEMFAEAERRAKEFWKLRTVINFTYPASPWNRSPMQFYFDEAKAYKDRYGKEWEEKFYEKYGADFFAFTASLSKSMNSVAPTMEGYQASKKYSDLLAENPEYGSLWVGDEDTGSFSGAVYAYQFANSLGPGHLTKQREERTPRQILDDINRRQGWMEYRKLNDLLKAEMDARGLRTLNVKAAADLAFFKKQVTEKIKEKFPAWREDFESFDSGKTQRLVELLQTKAYDDRFDDRPGWASLRYYLDARRDITRILDGREANGGSANLQAQSNADLADVWGGFVSQLTSRDLAFSDIYTRWLENDKVSFGGGITDATSG